MKRYIAFVVVFVIMAALLCGCSAEVSDEESADLAVEDFVVAATQDVYGSALYLYEAETSETVAQTTVSDNRKLIKTVTMTVETENFDNMLADLEANINACGGYIESVNVNSRYSAQRRTASYVIRIPAEQLDAFTDEVGSDCNVLSRSERQEDITLQYVDTESECAALRVEQERLLELLKTAENLTDILEIENRLTEIRYRLQSVEAQLRTYDNQVTYSTVNLTVDEVEVYTPTEEKGFWEKVGDGLLAGINGVWKFLKGLFYVLIVALPYLIVLGVIAGVILLVVFRFNRRRKRKRQTPPEM